MLETIWFVLWGLLWAVYFLLDGFDLGAGSLMPLLAKDEKDKRVFYQALGPFWDGNEVWLITAGGVTFAAFPSAYAVMFSALYTPLLLLLFALILRGVAFEFRSKIDSDGWRKLWDACLVIGSFVPALLLGVAFANIFQGIPIDTQGVYHGNLFKLLNPYGLLGGILFVLLFAQHGALWLSIKAPGQLKERALAMAGKIWWLTLLAAVFFLWTTLYATKLYDNYLAAPALWILPLLAVAALVATKVLTAKGGGWPAWGASGLTIVACTFFGVAGLYPNLLPSNLDPAASQTIHNAASSPLTLKIMLGVALTMVPVVIGYQFWAYRTFRHPVTEADLAHEEAY